MKVRLLVWWRWSGVACSRRRAVYESGGSRLMVGVGMGVVSEYTLYAVSSASMLADHMLLPQGSVGADGVLS